MMFYLEMLGFVQARNFLHFFKETFSQHNIFSGQSNMEWPMNAIFDSQAEIDVSKEYSRIHLFQVSHAASPKPMSETMTGRPKKVKRKFKVKE